MEQRDWTDVTGYFVRYRVSSAWSTEKQEEYRKIFKDAFAKKFATISLTSSIENNVTTLIAMNSLNSIGD